MAEDKRKSSDEEIADIRAELREASRLLKELIAESRAREEKDKQRAEEDKRRDEKRAEEDKRRDERDKQRQEAVDQQLAKDRAEQKERSRKIDAQIRELGKQIGGSHNRWGKIVEELVAGDLSAIVRTHLNGQAHRLSTRVRDDDRTWEIDVLATNGDIAVPAEVKTTLSIDAIDKFVSHILRRFTTLLPDHKHKRIYGVIAFVKIEGNESEVIEHALSQGLILVKAMHGTNKVLNAKDFAPRDFCPK